jgi:GNAT superfamily N-acetyltransferase
MSSGAAPADPEILERQALAMAARIAGDVALLEGGRFVLYPDPDEATWPRAAEIAREFGALAMPEVDGHAVRAAVARHLGADWGVYDWAVFSSPCDHAIAACRQVCAERPLPEGWQATLGAPRNAEEIAELYVLSATAGVSPLPPRALQGRMSPVLPLWLRDGAGRLCGSACAQAMFRPGTRLGETLSIHLVAIAPDLRGRGLGTLVAARAILAGAEVFGLSSVSAYIARDNLASQGAFRGCGLTMRANVVAMIATPGGARFTR